MEQALDYWQVEAYESDLPRHLNTAFKLAIQMIKQEPSQGWPVRGLPEHYKRLGLGKNLPEYNFYYRINLKESIVVLYLLRHGARNTYAPSTHRRMAAEARRRAEQARKELGQRRVKLQVEYREVPAQAG